MCTYTRAGAVLLLPTTSYNEAMCPHSKDPVYAGYVFFFLRIRPQRHVSVWTGFAVLLPLSLYNYTALPDLYSDKTAWSGADVLLLLKSLDDAWHMGVESGFAALTRFFLCACAALLVFQDMDSMRTCNYSDFYNVCVISYMCLTTSARLSSVFLNLLRAVWCTSPAKSRNKQPDLFICSILCVHALKSRNKWPDLFVCSKTFKYHCMLTLRCSSKYFKANWMCGGRLRCSHFSHLSTQCTHASLSKIEISLYYALVYSSKLSHERHMCAEISARPLPQSNLT